MVIDLAHALSTSNNCYKFVSINLNNVTYLGTNFYESYGQYTNLIRNVNGQKVIIPTHTEMYHSTLVEEGLIKGEGQRERERGRERANLDWLPHSLS